MSVDKTVQSCWMQKKNRLLNEQELTQLVFQTHQLLHQLQVRRRIRGLGMLVPTSFVKISIQMVQISVCRTEENVKVSSRNIGVKDFERVHKKDWMG